MVYITLGDGAELGVDGERLVAIQRNERGLIIALVDLGKATEKRLDQVKEYLDRLAVHAVK